MYINDSTLFYQVDSIIMKMLLSPTYVGYVITLAAIAVCVGPAKGYHCCSHLPLLYWADSLL